jgi:hypothetical protein
MYGRIAKTTSQFIDVTLQQRGVQKWQNSGERWSQRMIQSMIWDTLLSLWNNRNAIIYDSHTTMNKQDIMRDRLKMKVERCYSYADTLKLPDRQLLFHLTENELTAEDPRYIKAWLKNADRIIRVSKQEECRQTHEKTMMENYFKWRPSSKLPRKKRKRIQHLKQDLRPD